MATATVITAPGADKLSTESTALSQRALEVVVTDKRSAEAAVAVRNDLRRLSKQIGETFDPLIKQAHEQHKALIATKTKFSAPVETAIGGINRKVVAYEMEQERQRKIEQQRLEELARKERESQALAEAAELEAQGEVEAAEQVVMEAIEAPAPAVIVQKEHISGATFRSVWEWEITDLSKIPLNLLTVREGTNGRMTEISTIAIGSMVRSMHMQAEKQVPGIKVYERKIVA